MERITWPYKGILHDLVTMSEQGGWTGFHLAAERGDGVSHHAQRISPCISHLGLQDHRVWINPPLSNTETIHIIQKCHLMDCCITDNWVWLTNNTWFILLQDSQCSGVWLRYWAGDKKTRSSVQALLPPVVCQLVRPISCSVDLFDSGDTICLDKISSIDTDDWKQHNQKKS